MTERDAKVVGLVFGYTNFITGEHEYKPWYHDSDFGAKTHSAPNFKSFKEMVNVVKNNGPDSIHVAIFRLHNYGVPQIKREIQKLAKECEYAVTEVPFDPDKSVGEYRLIKEVIITPSMSTVKKLSKQKMSPKLSKAKISRLVEWRKSQ
jgi:hypothetical protein